MEQIGSARALISNIIANKSETQTLRPGRHRQRLRRSSVGKRDDVLATTFTGTSSGDHGILSAPRKRHASEITPRTMLTEFQDGHDTIQTTIRKRPRLESPSRPASRELSEPGSPPASLNRSRGGSTSLRKKATMKHFLQTQDMGPTPRTLLQGFVNDADEITPIHPISSQPLNKTVGDVTTQDLEQSSGSGLGDMTFFSEYLREAGGQSQSLSQVAVEQRQGRQRTRQMDVKGFAADVRSRIESQGDPEYVSSAEPDDQYEEQSTGTVDENVTAQLQSRLSVTSGQSGLLDRGESGHEIPRSADRVLRSARRAENLPQSPRQREDVSYILNSSESVVQSLRARNSVSGSFTRSPGHRESIPRSPGHRESVPRSPGHIESVPRSPGHRESVPRSPGRRESVPRSRSPEESAPRSPGHGESAPRSPGRRESVPRSPGRRESVPRSPGHRESVPRIPGRRESFTKSPASSRDISTSDARRRSTRVSTTYLDSSPQRARRAPSDADDSQGLDRQGRGRGPGEVVASVGTTGLLSPRRQSGYRGGSMATGPEGRLAEVESAGGGEGEGHRVSPSDVAYSDADDAGDDEGYQQHMANEEDDRRSGDEERDGRQRMADEEDGERGVATEEEEDGSVSDEDKRSVADEEDDQGVADEEDRGVADEEDRGVTDEEDDDQGVADEDDQGVADEDDYDQGVADEDDDDQGVADEDDDDQSVADDAGPQGTGLHPDTRVVDNMDGAVAVAIHDKHGRGDSRNLSATGAGAGASHAGSGEPASSTVPVRGLLGDKEHQATSATSRAAAGGFTSPWDLLEQAEKSGMLTNALLRQGDTARPQPKRARAKKATAKAAGPSKQSKEKGKPKVVRLPASLTKGIFQNFSRLKVDRRVMEEVLHASDMFWKNASSDLAAYADHADRVSVTQEDVNLLMRRQGLVTERQSLFSLVEKFLPLEYRQEVIPVVRSGNVLVPRR